VTRMTVYNLRDVTPVPFPITFKVRGPTTKPRQQVALMMLDRVLSQSSR
jgi:hypothetical protein